MARYSGYVGYVITKEVRSGVWKPQIIERYMRGNVLSVTGRAQEDNKVNEDIKLNLRISVIADAFSFENFMYITYAHYAGVKWRVNSVEIMHPRLILNIGEIYNGQEI